MRRILSTAILLALTVVLGTGCAGMGGQREDLQAQYQRAVQAQAERDAQQDKVLAGIADELRLAREAREAAAAPEADPEVVETVVADGEGDADTNTDDTEAVVVEALPEAPTPVAVPLADNSGDSDSGVVNFAAEDRAQACVMDLMQKGADVDRPTSAVKAAYVCSHLYGLDHNRGLEDKTVSHELSQDGKAFEANLSQRQARFQHVLDLDSGDDNDYRLGRGFSVLPASLSADSK